MAFKISKLSKTKKVYFIKYFLISFFYRLKFIKAQLSFFEKFEKNSKSSQSFELQTLKAFSKFSKFYFLNSPQKLLKVFYNFRIFLTLKLKKFKIW